VTVRGALVQMGRTRSIATMGWDEIARNPFFCPDKDKAAFFEGLPRRYQEEGILDRRRDRGERGRRAAGLGAPIYASSDGGAAAALMSINAVKGSRSAQASVRPNCRVRKTPTRCDGNQGVSFLSNHAGGILGGISTGQPVVASLCGEAHSSICRRAAPWIAAAPDTDIMTKGRHDP